MVCLLQKLGDPVVLRHREAELRPAACEELGRALLQVRKAVDAYEAKVSGSVC